MMEKHELSTNPNTLLDTFHLKGYDYEEFRAAVAAMSSITEFERVRCSDITPVSVMGQNDEYILGVELNPSAKLFEALISPFGEYVLEKDVRTTPMDAAEARSKEYGMCLNFLNLLSKNFTKTSKEAFYRNYDFTDVLDEIEAAGLLFNLKDHFFPGLESCDSPVYLTSSMLSSDLVLLNIKGDFAGEATLVRNAAIAQQLRSCREVTLVSRKIDGVKKVFAMRSGNYTPIPQTILCDIVDFIAKDNRMGRIKVHEWEISHNYTSISIEFPEQDFGAAYGLPTALIPGVHLITSDTGDCAITAYETWRVKGSVSWNNKVSRIHSGSVSREDVFKAITDTIFSAYTKLPEALCDLMCIEIAPEADLATAAGRKTNYNAIRQILKNAMKELDAVKAIGKKNEVRLREAMECEFDASRHYTAYDVAISIMTLPERACGLKTATMEALKKMVAKAPFIEYEKEIEEEELVLC